MGDVEGQETAVGVADGDTKQGIAILACNEVPVGIFNRDTGIDHLEVGAVDDTSAATPHLFAGLASELRLELSELVVVLERELNLEGFVRAGIDSVDDTPDRLVDLRRGNAVNFPKVMELPTGQEAQAEGQADFCRYRRSLHNERQVRILRMKVSLSTGDYLYCAELGAHLLH